MAVKTEDIVELMNKYDDNQDIRGALQLLLLLGLSRQQWKAWAFCDATMRPPTAGQVAEVLDVQVNHALNILYRLEKIGLIKRLECGKKEPFRWFTVQINRDEVDNLQHEKQTQNENKDK